MKNTNRRFVFTDYENLLKVKFRKLEKVCDRLFIFVAEDQELISLSLVRQIQKMGKAVKWVPIDMEGKNSVHLSMAFVMGSIHQKVGPDIEFAILSNDTDLDPLVNYINDKGRDCLRIQQKKQHTEDTATGDLPMVIDELGGDHPGEDPEPILQGAYEGESLIRDTAKETVRRLVHSGNRPAEIETLRRYIQLYNQELTEYDGNVDLIINRMEANKEIEIQKGVVKYNF